MRRLLAVVLVVVILVGSAPVAPVSAALSARSAAADAGSPVAADGPHVADGASVTSIDRAFASADRASATSRVDRARPPAQSENGSPESLAVTDEFDSVEFHITVFNNGTAEWTFTYQRTLNNDTEKRRFEKFAREFNNNSTPMWRDFKGQAGELAAAGQNFTGRTMQAQNFRKEAFVGGLVNDNRGIVTMTFQWTGFTHSDNQTIIMGDVFQGGLYIGPNQSLVVHSGPGLQFTSVDPSEPAQPSSETLAESGTVTWEGEYDFNDKRPRVKFDPVETTTTTTTTGNGVGTGPGETPATTQSTRQTAAQPPAGGDDWSPLMMFVGAVVVLLGLAAAFAWRQGDFGSLSDGGSASNPGGGGGGTGGTTASGESSGGTTQPSVSDEELLTDEARVKKLLDENGGRMKQVNIVEETGWSKSKVSMLLSEMEEDGQISKLRVGRENIISLEGHEPDAAGSPLEE